ncbi:MAG: hypothetical protein ACE5R6_09460 [Candidatus Heimdallarchaeota archaeon]
MRIVQIALLQDNYISDERKLFISIGREGLAIASTPGAQKLTVASLPHSIADNEFINTTARYHEGEANTISYHGFPSNLRRSKRYYI